MALTNFVPTIWSQEINFQLYTMLVALSVVNRDYEGEIANHGDTVKINRPAAVTVSTYNVGSDISFQVPTSTQTTLSINQQNYIAITIDDVRKAQANIELMRPYVQEGAYALADTLDTFIFSKYTGADAGNVIAKATLSNSTIWDALVSAKKNLSLNNVPTPGRWMVLSPNEIALLEDSSEFQRASQLGDDVSRNGFAGRAAGFDIFESNNLTVANDGSHNVRHCVYGTNAAITFANQLTKMESGRHEKQFADYVRGLMLYGAAVVKPKALGDLRAIVA